MVKKCEICEESSTGLDKHHIHSKSMGGSDNKSNKAFLCPNCHRKVHLGKIIIEGRFNTTDGDLLIWRNENENSITGLNDPPCYIYNTC